MTDQGGPGQLPGVRNARGPAQGQNYHSFCQTCHRVIYNLRTHGPMMPHQQNRTFCTCGGKATGEIQVKVTVYDLEDILSPTEAKKERERQAAEAAALEAKKKA